MEKNLKEFGDKVSAQEKGEAEAALAAARSAMESNDPTALKQSTERLSQAAMKIGEAMYKAQAADQAAGATAQAGGAGPGGPVPVRDQARGRALPAAPSRTRRWWTPSSKRWTRRRSGPPDRPGNGPGRRARPMCHEWSRPRFI